MVAAFALISFTLVNYITRPAETPSKGEVTKYVVGTDVGGLAAAPPLGGAGFVFI